MAKGTIKIQMTLQRLTALADVYRELERDFAPDGDYELLLHEHIKALCLKLNALEMRDQLNFTLQLTSVEALAFQQLWSGGVNVDHYTGVVVSEIVQKVNKASLEPKRLIGAR